MLLPRNPQLAYHNMSDIGHDGMPFVPHKFHLLSKPCDSWKLLFCYGASLVGGPGLSLSVCISSVLFRRLLFGLLLYIWFVLYLPCRHQVKSTRTVHGGHRLFVKGPHARIDRSSNFIAKRAGSIAERINSPNFSSDARWDQWTCIDMQQMQSYDLEASLWVSLHSPCHPHSSFFHTVRSMRVKFGQPSFIAVRGNGNTFEAKASCLWCWIRQALKLRNMLCTFTTKICPWSSCAILSFTMFHCHQLDFTWE